MDGELVVEDDFVDRIRTIFLISMGTVDLCSFLGVSADARDVRRSHSRDVDQVVETCANS